MPVKDPVVPMIAVPIATIFVPVRLSCWIETLTVWPIPDLYPDPLYPIEIEDIVPAVETVAIPPAATKG